MTQNPVTFSWKRPFIAAVICLLILLVLNDIAIRLSLYFAYKWLDIPFHFFSGFSVGLASIGILRALYKERYTYTKQLLYVVLLTFFVGAAWECVEAYFNAPILFGPFFWFDTSKDLLMDTLGGILSYICFHPHKKIQPEQN
ncbi:MAG: hypothetical protein V4576_02100 [Patescibacteria group bacterium]